MKNKLKIHQTLDSVKYICLSKDRKYFYGILLFLFIVSNVIFVLGINAPSNNVFTSDDMPHLVILLMLLGFSVCIFVMTPFCLKKEYIQTNGDEEAQPSVLVKILSLWVPFCVHLIAQMLVFEICYMLSLGFDISFIFLLLTSAALCVLIFVWIIFCACLYMVTKSIHWYTIGLSALNIAPMVISRGCYEIYNSNSLLPHKSVNPLEFNPFLLSLSAALARPWMFILISVVIIGVCACFLSRSEKRPETNSNALSTAYKIVVIFLISLSGAFLLANRFVGEGRIESNYNICFLGVALSAAILLACFTFRSKRLLLRTGITVFAVAVSSVFILGFIPARVQNDAYILPDEEEIENVELFLDSLVHFKADKYFEDCIVLHEMLLDLFEEGYLPDETEQPYEKPKCIADLWDDIDFRYKLKNGEAFYREYRGLRDSAFDEFYINFLKSDMYAYSLQKTKMDNPAMRYYPYGNVGGKWCELPESCVEELLKTYCDELKKADKSAFYEKYETISFTGVYDFSDMWLYIPLSFTNTRNLAEQYWDMYKVK